MMKVKSLEKFRLIGQWYVLHSTSYNKTINTDIDLTNASRNKMKALLKSFITRVNEFITAIDNLKPAFVQEKDIRIIGQFNLLEEELERIHKLFEKIAVTTPKLLGVKRKIDEKIRNYEMMERRRVQSPKKATKTKPDLNAKWLDNLMQEVNTRNESIKNLKKIECKVSPKKSEVVEEEIIEDPSVYLTGFRGIQSEFAALRNQMECFAKRQRTQGYNELVKNIITIADNVKKISNDNKTIISEHSELMEILRVLGILY